MLGGVPGAGQRHLVRSRHEPVVFLAVDVVRAGPALGGAEDDHRPLRALLIPGVRAALDLRDLVEHLVQQRREPAVDVSSCD